MSIWIASSVFATVIVFCVYVLRASGAWEVLFAPRLRFDLDRDHNPLASSPRGWIENHEFWNLVEEETDEEAEIDPAEVFWGTERTRDAG
jgi:hypothetical protein